MLYLLDVAAARRLGVRGRAGVGSLVVFAVALTRVDSLFAGRVYAAYGGIYIVASLVWLWLAVGGGRV